MLMTATSEAQDSWAFATGESPSLVGGGQPVTLVEETSFCLSTAGGDIEPGSYLAYSVYGYVLNGGGRCYIVRIGTDQPSGNGQGKPQ